MRKIVDLIKRINLGYVLLTIIASCMIFMCLILLQINESVLRIKRDIAIIELDVSSMSSDISAIEAAILLK